MRLRVLASLAAVLALGTTAVACGDDSGDDTTTPAETSGGGDGEYAPIPDGPIVFGVSAPLSGPTAAFGLAIQKAFENVTLANFNRNHPDGIDGHPIEIRVLDDASDVTKAVAVANEMVADKYAAVITVTNNPAAAPQQAAIFNKAEMPMFSAVLGQEEYTDTAKWPYLFAVGPSLVDGARVTAEWIASHPEIKEIGVLTDDSPSSDEQVEHLKAALAEAAPDVEFGTTASVTPGGDASTAIGQLKSSDPDLLWVNMGYGYGPVWQGLQTAKWSPMIFTSAGAWYDSFAAMGDLAKNAYAAYYECVEEDHTPFNDTVKAAMDGYASVFGTTSTNYLTFVTSDDGPLELLKKAIETHHSIEPEAIKDALENMGPTKVMDTVEYHYTADNHFGVTGEYGAAVCKLDPTTDGAYRIPLKAD
jgi:ABC-type branched-subunit amino acid transport system substrate-binding protein